jgi:type I restriction enzyme R subunit
LNNLEKQFRKWANRGAAQPFWQDESYDHWVRGPEELEKIVSYIEENPVAAGLVERVEDWRWSSAFGIRE